MIQTLGEIKSGKVFRGVLRILGEYVEGMSDIQSTLQEIREVLGEIPVLASEQQLLDETSGGDDDGGDEGKKEKKAKDWEETEGVCGWDVCDGNDLLPPLRSEFGTKLVLWFDELTDDSAASNAF